MRIMTRRSFIALFLVSGQESPTIPVAVLETFEAGDSAIAILVHHSDSNRQREFADWIHAHPATGIRVRNAAGQEVRGMMFRVRMCFGRGLIVLSGGLRLKEHDTVTVSLLAK